ncbi:YggT family protein, partial [Campylobacter jejuni]|nr:YggT family protein [Campylobacter jejuni]
MVIDSFIISIFQVLQIVINIYTWIIIITALLSWVNPDPYNPIVQI